MKRWALVLGIVAVIVIAGWLTLSYYGGRFIRTRLQQAMEPELRVGEISVYPTHVSLKGIQHEDPASKKRMFQIEEIRIYPSLLAALRGAVQIRKCALIKPSFFLYRSRDGRVIGPFPAGGKERMRPVGSLKSLLQEGRRQEPGPPPSGSIDFKSRKGPRR